MRKKHFTLIEIMIVVAIIALLALIALPNFMQARAKARDATCIANLKQIEGAKQTWAIQTPGSESITLTSSLLTDYFVGGIDKIICPEDSSNTFATSYDLGDIAGTIVSCNIDATDHTL